MCEAVPGAKGATRRRKVYVVIGVGYWRQGKALQGIAGGTSVSSGWENSGSETLGPFLAL